MPNLTVDTNVPADKVPQNFNEEVTAILEESLGKPKKYIAVLVRGGQRLTFAGTAEPAAICTLTCIGKIGLEENKSYTEKLMKKMTDDMGIPADRIYINFVDFPRPNVGWNNTTFG